MTEFSFGIYIASYKRAKTATTHKLLDKYTYVVRKSEEQEYIDNGCSPVWAVEDSLIDGMVKVNQYIVDNAPEDVICVLDDDIEYMTYRMYDSDRIKDPATATAELERIGQIMFDLNIGFGTIDATQRPWNYDAEFNFKGPGGALRWFNRNVYKAKMNEELEYNYDLDLILQELLYNRVILKPKYICCKAGTDTNEGGASAKQRKDQIACIDLMKQKWGKYFSYNLKTNVPHINVKR